MDRDGNRHRMAFVRGKTIKKLKVLGKATRHRAPRSASSPTPRSSRCWSSTTPPWPTGCAQLAFLNKGITITIKDEREDQKKQETFFAKGGLIQFVEWLNRNKKPLHPKPIAFSATKDEVEVDLALQYEDGYNENTFTFVNNINTHEGGTHLTGFKSALTRTINDVAKRRDFLKKEDFTLSGEDIREGLTCVLHVKVKEPQFEGQTKTKLGNCEVEGIVEGGGERAARHLPGGAPAGRAEHHREGGERGPGARGGAQGARPGPQEVRAGERRAPRQAGRLLATTIRRCASSTWSRATPPAAAPSRPAKREFQAILPLRGKILNVEKARIDKILSNEEIRAMITAIGTGVKDDFKLEDARYHKIVLMTDADVDGAHIRTLLLTFFFRQMQELIEAGYVYIAQPPLYRVAKGKEVFYAYSEGERDEYTKRLTGGDGKGNVNIQRYKGLGEMNPDQLWDTTMDPEKRTVLRVTMEDAVEASKLFDELMGDEVEPRRQFIERNAKYVTNLDV